MANEKRLIDCEQAKRATYEEIFWTESEQAVVRNFLAKLPKVDAVEVPPVKIGDTAYFIINKKIYEAKICLINWSQYRYTTTTEIRGEVQKYHSVSASFSDWGVTVFATKEEAERVLYPCEHCISGTYRSCEGCSHGERRTDDK